MHTMVAKVLQGSMLDSNTMIIPFLQNDGESSITRAQSRASYSLVTQYVARIQDSDRLSLFVL